MPATSPEAVKDAVRKTYGAIATTPSPSGCCAPGCCGGTTPTSSADIGYSDAERNAVPDGADLGLGCGNPQAIAALMAGERPWTLQHSSEEGVEQIEAGENGRIGEHMAEFVPDHTLEFGFVEQMDNRTIEIDLVPEAQAGKELRARSLGVQFLLPDQVDRSGILGKARSAEDALSQSHQ